MEGGQGKPKRPIVMFSHRAPNFKIENREHYHNFNPNPQIDGFSTQPHLYLNPNLTQTNNKQLKPFPTNLTHPAQVDCSNQNNQFLSTNANTSKYQVQDFTEYFNPPTQLAIFKAQNTPIEQIPEFTKLKPTKCGDLPRQPIVISKIIFEDLPREHAKQFQHACEWKHSMKYEIDMEEEVKDPFHYC